MTHSHIPNRKLGDWNPDSVPGYPNHHVAALGMPQKRHIADVADATHRKTSLETWTRLLPPHANLQQRAQHTDKPPRTPTTARGRPQKTAEDHQRPPTPDCNESPSAHFAL